MVKSFVALIKRDILLSLKDSSGAGTAIGFFCVVLIMIPLSIDSEVGILNRIAPGMLWVTLLLSVLLSVDRVFHVDYEDGSLEAMFLSRIPFELIVLAKILAHWLTTCFPLAIGMPVFAIMLGLEVNIIPWLIFVVLIGTITLSGLGALGAAITVGIRKGGLLISILILPLYIPVLIFGTIATRNIMGDTSLFNASVIILASLALACLVLCPFACTAAVRSYYE